MKLGTFTRKPSPGALLPGWLVSTTPISFAKPSIHPERVNVRMDDIVHSTAGNEILIQVLTFSFSVRPAHPVCRTPHRLEFLPSLQACVYPLPHVDHIGHAGDDLPTGLIGQILQSE